MSKKTNREPLWDDLLADAAPPEFRQALLARTVGAARRRRRGRTALCAIGMLVPLALLLMLREPIEPIAQHQLPPIQPAAPRAAAGSDRLSKPQIISDDELFAMFPNHAVALVGPPDNQRLVILGPRE